MALLRLLGLGVRDRQTLREVVGHGAAAPRNRREVPHLAVAENRQLRGRAAEVDQRNADILFVIGHDGQRRGERLVDGRFDAVPCPAHGLAQVLRRRRAELVMM